MTMTENVSVVLDLAANFLEMFQKNTGVEPWALLIVALLLCLAVVKFVVFKALKVVILCVVAVLVCSGVFVESEWYESGDVAGYVESHLGDAEDVLDSAIEAASELAQDL